MPSFKDRVNKRNQCIISVHISPLLNEQKQKVNLNNANLFSALIDTGAQVTSISKKVVANINLSPSGKINFQSASDLRKVNCFKILLFLPITKVIDIPNTNKKQSDTSFLTVPLQNTPESPIITNDFDLIIGMDILLKCNFILAHGEFILSY